MDKIRVIKNAADYEAALARLDELMDLNPAKDSAEDYEMGELAAVIAYYERRQGYMQEKEPVTALEMIKYRMEEAGLTRKDMEAYLGSPGKVSEILSGRRRLSLTMIKKLHKGLGIPAEILIQ